MLKLFVLFYFFVLVSAQDGRFELNILHYNDFHARFEETNLRGGVCDESGPCIGGFARLATAVREGFEREPQSLLLNGGDSFQGTIWYNLFRWEVTKEFMNMLPHDAHVLGNHEFDNGIEGVVPYLQQLNSTVLAANIIDDDEPTIQGLYEKSTIVERNGRKIGIIGVIIASTDTLASTGNLRFKDEIETVKEEAEKLHEQGVNIIIVLSHSGIDVDRDIALNGGPYIDIIVGGHSHTLLFNGAVEPGTAFIPRGPYPLVVNQTGTQRPVLIVQAGAHTAYLGELKVVFDSAGNILEWGGNPHYLRNEIVQAPDVLQKITEYLPVIELRASMEVGSTMVDLSSSCACRECNLGNLICDSYMHAALERAQNNSWHYAHFCVINQGGIRTSINHGVITYASVIMTTPFENRIEVYDLKGQHILEMLEFAVANDPFAGARMLQSSGLRVKFNGMLPVNQRVLEVLVRCIECEVPKYEKLDVDKYYKIVSQNFIAEGGDGFNMISNNRKNVEVIGVDYEILMDYIRHQSPLFSEIDGRMQIDYPCRV